MIRLAGESENATTVEITGAALRRIKDNMHWEGACKGFLLGLAVSVAFCWLMTLTK